MIHRRTPMPMLLSVAAVFLSAIPNAEAKRVVVLDPGHGGADNGAKWGGIAEKHLTLDLAKRVEKILKQNNIPTIMTRRRDVTVSLDGRARSANKFSDALFVSIHFNASRNRSVKGIETFYMSSKGRTFASIVQSRLANRIRTRNRGIKQKSNFAVLRKTKGPAILVECGFISNSWERERCKSSWFKNILAQEIAAGITSYYRR